MRALPLEHTAALQPENSLCDSKLVLMLQVPVRIFVTKQLPKTATGKIQRRMMVEHFIKGPGQEEEAGKGGAAGSRASGKAPPQPPRSKL